MLVKLPDSIFRVKVDIAYKLLLIVWEKVGIEVINLFFEFVLDGMRLALVERCMAARMMFFGASMKNQWVALKVRRQNLVDCIRCLNVN